MCFEINSLKPLKLTILRFFNQVPTPSPPPPLPPTLTYTSLIAASHLLSISLHEFT